MRTNPFYDAWLFLTGQTSEHAASGIGWLLTLLYLALLAASIFIALTNWRRDPAIATQVISVRAGDPMMDAEL